jgi:hypothetical protein
VWKKSKMKKKEQKHLNEFNEEISRQHAVDHVKRTVSFVNIVRTFIENNWYVICCKLTVTFDADKKG